MSDVELPSWALPLLRSPRRGDTARLEGGKLLAAGGAEIGRVEQGVLRIPVERTDEGIAFYRKVGGAHFHERAAVPFAMSALDTPLYHAYLTELGPADKEAVIADIGGGDGRNAWPWLEQGYRRIIVVDAAAEALMRFRVRVAAEDHAWLDRVLLVEADVRSLPFVGGAARVVLAIEALGCLNEDHAIGLAECARLLASDGRILISERDYEAGLVLRLLYHGLDGMLETATTHWLRDGPADALLRTRPFTEAELVGAICAAGLSVLDVKGTPLLSLLLGWMNGRGMLDEGENRHLPEIRSLLDRLGRIGAMRRSHVVVAERRDARS